MFIIPDIHDICDTFDRYYIKTCCPCCRPVAWNAFSGLFCKPVVIKKSHAPLIVRTFSFPSPQHQKSAPEGALSAICHVTLRLFSLQYTHISLFQDSPLSGSRFLMHTRPIRMTNRHPRSCMIVAMHTGSKDACPHEKSAGQNAECAVFQFVCRASFAE